MNAFEKVASDLYHLHNQIALAGAAVAGVFEANGLEGSWEVAICDQLADCVRLADDLYTKAEDLAHVNRRAPNQESGDDEASRPERISELQQAVDAEIEAGRIKPELAEGLAEYLADLGPTNKTPAEHFRKFTRTLVAGPPEGTEAASLSRDDKIGERKILHMQVRGRGSKQEVVALCDDGSLWLGDWGAEDREGGVVYPDNFGWWRLPGVPGQKARTGKHTEPRHV